MEATNHILASEFNLAAQKFCDNIQSVGRSERIDLDALIIELMRIYTAAIKLPNVEPDSVELDVCSPTSLHFSFGERDVYWEIYNPFDLDEPVCGSLTEDLRSICDELCMGMEYYKGGHINDALWTWRFGFRNHWSFHAVDAIRALNKLAMGEDC